MTSEKFLLLLKNVPLIGWLGAVFGLFVFLSLLVKVPLGYNVRNLMVRWRITFLTALAFTLVVGLLTVMLAFVNGMYRLTDGSARPGNVIVLSDGATDELFSTLIFTDMSDVENQPGVLSLDEKRKMCSREVYIVVNQPVPVKEGEKPRRRFIQLRGIEDPEVSGQVHGLDLYPGGAWFSSAGVQEISGQEGDKGKRQAIQAVLGEGAAREIGKDRGRDYMLQAGDTFDVGPRQWVVVGVMKSSGSTFDSEVWAKRDIVGPMFGKETFTTLVLRTDGAKQAETLADYLTHDYKKTPLKAVTESEYYSKLGETNKQFLYAIIFVAVIMAVGGIFGVMNTMFAAISQRIKDIGVLRILGFSSFQVLMSFFLESIVIAILGGLIGCALGYIVADGRSATSIVSSGQGGGKSVVLKLVVDSTIVSAGMLFTLIMGALGGLLPSLSAMRLRPLESLR